MSDHISEQVLNAYLDGELKGNEKKSVQMHLEVCAECRTKLEGLSALVSHLGSLPREAEPSSELWPAIARRTRRMRLRHRQPAISIWRQLAFTAVVLLAAATGASVFRMYITADQAPEGEALQPQSGQAISVDVVRSPDVVAVRAIPADDTIIGLYERQLILNDADIRTR